MPAEKKAEVDRLRASAMLASREGRHGEALKHLHRGMALMRGVEWTPAVSRASALAIKADHAIWEPGQTVKLGFEKLYEPDGTTAESVTARVQLVPMPSGQPMSLKQWTLNGSKLETGLEVPRIAVGKYRLEITVPPLARPKTLNVSVEPGIRKRVARLEDRLSKLTARQSAGTWTAQYAVELFRRADESLIDPSHFDFSRELDWGDQVTDALEAKRDPFAGRVGDIRRAYRSNVDRTLQPYRLYVPTAYSAAQNYPLIVALHGMGGDENTLFDRYNSRGLQELAEQYSYFILAPKGREPASMYRGSAEQDVMDALAEVRAAYRIDPNRIYMMGHSMGAFGSWSIAMNHPDVFAALAPVAGGGNPTSMQKIRHIPQLVVHGDNDKTVPVRSSRVMVEAAKALGTEVEYVEVKGGGHVDVFVPAIPKMFEWFNSHPKK
jgi:predicted esterase